MPDPSSNSTMCCCPTLSAACENPVGSMPVLSSKEESADLALEPLPEADRLADRAAAFEDVLQTTSPSWSWLAGRIFAMCMATLRRPTGQHEVDADIENIHALGAVSQRISPRLRPSAGASVL